MKEWMIVAVLCVVVYEIIEHLGLPLFWAFRNRRRASACGPTAMVGRNCIVKQWEGTQGKVTYQNEIWNAVGQTTLTPGSTAQILKVQGLTLIVAPSGDRPIASTDGSGTAP